MQLSDRMQHVHFSSIRQVFDKAGQMEKQGENIIHLELGRPDFDTPPHIVARAKQAMDDGQLHYTANAGIIELRAAIARKLERDNGLYYDPNGEILVTLGVTEAIQLAMTALLNPGDEVLIPDPAFICYAYAARMCGAVPVAVPLSAAEGFLPSRERIEAHVTERTRMICINTPHNPTGMVYPPECLEAVAALAAERDLVVISDEIYEKIIFDGHRHASIGRLPGMKARTVTLNGFSKCYAMTGWRLGYAATSPQIMSGLLRAHQYTAVCAASFAQWGAVEALEGPQDSVRQMVAEFERRRNMIVERLEQVAGLSVVRPGGGLFVFVGIEALKRPALEVADYLLETAKIALVPWGRDHIRISFANSYENLAAAMDRMVAALNRLTA